MKTKRKTKKILCVCRWGNIRSVALARLLKKEGFDALSCGVNAMREDTKKMLANWADVILIPSEKYRVYFSEYEKKVFDMEIGEDIWKDADHPDLLLLVKRRYYRVKAQLYF